MPIEYLEPDPSGAMSEEFTPFPSIAYAEFIKALDALRLTIIEPKNYHDPHGVWISDGVYGLRAFREDDGSVTFERFGTNEEAAILARVSKHFGVEILGEYETRSRKFWEEQEKREQQ